MNTSRKFTDLRSGYKSFEQIPEHRRLTNYEEDFKDTDLWAEYFEAQHSGEGYSKTHIRDTKRAADRWKSFCEDHETHPALTTPSLVNEWCKCLIKSMMKRSAKTNYLDKINRFYRYLVWHIDYPHWYNPVQYAVSEYEVAEKVSTARPGDNKDE